MATSGLIDELLLRGVEDWVMASDVAWLIKLNAPERGPALTRTDALQLIEDVVKTGLMVLGDVADAGFVPWDVPVDEALHRVRSSWRLDVDVPGLGEVCWLANTRLGDERAGK